MQQGHSGFEPVPGLLERQLQDVSELHYSSMPDYEIVESEPLLDSSDMTPAVWQTLAETIKSAYEQFDGFVVVHGTDTMAYTTSALSFMLQGIQKPIVFTGSQIPLGSRRNDAREHLITSIILASEHSIPEVCLYFGGKVLRGNRTTKISASDLIAFDSPNYPPLGFAQTHITIHHDTLLSSSLPALTPRSIEQHRIATFKLFPGLAVDVLENLLKEPIQALILESFGVGNGPTSHEFTRVLARAAKRGVVVVNCSQCTHGCVDMNDYATGKALADAGVISGRDMTIEAAVAKLMFLLTHEESTERIKDQIPRSIAGELSESES